MQLQVKYIINWHVMYVRVLLGILDSPVPPLPYQHVIAYNNLDVPWAATQLTPPVPIPLYTYLQWPNSIPTGYHLFPIVVVEETIITPKLGLVLWILVVVVVVVKPPLVTDHSL